MGESILGPIDYLAVEWPRGHVTGEGFRLLMDLVDREIVRVLDILFIAKDGDGNVSTVEPAEWSIPRNSMPACGACLLVCSTKRTSTRSPRQSSREASRGSSCTRTCEADVGLLKTGLKAVVAVKTADVIHERVLARQQEHAAAHGYPAPVAAVAQPAQAAPIAGAVAQPAQAAPLPPAAGTPDMAGKLAQLRQLGELRESGVLTDAEFEAQKGQILSA